MIVDDRWWGWETLLAFSLYGGLLQILPLPSGLAWKATIFGFACSMFWAGGTVINRGFRLSYHIKWFGTVFSLLLLWILASLFWSPIDLSRLVIGDAYIISHMIAPTMVILLFGVSPYILAKRWLIGALIAMVPIFLYTAYVWLTSSRSLYLVFLGHDQAIYLGIGVSLMSFALICLVWFIYCTTYRKSAFALGAFAFWMTNETGARGPLLWGVVSILIMAAFDIHRRRGSINRWTRIISLFSIFILVSYLTASQFIQKEVFMDRAASITRMFSDIDRGFDDQSSIGARMMRYNEAITLMYDSPIIGNGALSYRVLTTIAGETYPHNIVLDTLSDLGVVGFILVAFLFFKAFYGAWCVAGDRQKVYGIMGATLFIYYFGMAMSSGYLYWSIVWPWAAITVTQIQPKAVRL